MAAYSIDAVSNVIAIYISVRTQCIVHLHIPTVLTHILLVPLVLKVLYMWTPAILC